MWWLALACTGEGEVVLPLSDDSDTRVVEAPDTAEVVETDDDSDPAVTSSDTDRAAPSAPASWGPGFRDETQELAVADVLPVSLGSFAPAQEPESGFGAIGDIDEDGHPEIIVGNGHHEDPVGRVDLRVYTWHGPGDLRRSHALEAKVGSGEIRPWELIDLDDDGHLDMLVASEPPRVRWGAGDGTFPEETVLDLRSERRDPFRSGGAVYDLDDDGWLDLLLGVAGCDRVVVPWLRTGPRSFEPREDLVTETTGGARTTAVLPMVDTHGGRTWVAVADSCDRSSPHPGFYRIERADPLLPPRATAVDLAPADAIWRFDPVSGGGPMTLVAPMGAATTDWDLDGELDLALALGIQRFVLLAGQAGGTWSDRSQMAGVVAAPPAPGFIAELAWGVGAADLDQDGWPDLMIAMGDDATSLRLVRGQTMQPQAWRNLGGWSFAEVTADVGFNLDGGWHGLVLHDLEGDGDADVLLGGFGVPPRLLHNRIETGNHGLAVALRGTTSNRYGLGAIVRAEIRGLPPRTLMMGESGNLEGQSYPLLFLGLGPNDVVDRLEITWPSGHVQEVLGLTAGRLHEIVEPPTLDVLLPLRRAPAGTAVELRVTPRHPDGSVDGTASVDVTMSAGGLRSAARQSDGSWLVRFMGPDQPGTSVIEVRVNGVPLGVRPRLWWD